MKIDIGGFEANIIEADRYLQIDDIGDAMLGRIWKKVATDYAGYDKWFCYHNNKAPAELLAEMGAILLDASIEMRMRTKKFDDSASLGVTRVTKEWFGEFAAYHDRKNPEVYWTSERIARDASRWGIFSLRDDKRTQGYLLLSIGSADQSEFFCIDAANTVQCEMLMKSAITFAFQNGKKEVLYMADDEIGRTAAISVGFSVTGFYQGYMIKRTE